MLSKLKASLTAIAILLILSAGAFTAPLDAHAQQAPAAKAAPKAKSSGVPIIGKSADGKYSVYKIDGDIGDDKFTVNGRLYKDQDLVTRMGFIEPADTKTGKYFCGFLCKDGMQNIVGINPKYKWMAN